jgi:adenylosuccinate synthase
VKNRKARRYDQLQPETILFIEEIERVSGAPVTLIGTCFDERSVIDRRHH